MNTFTRFSGTVGVLDAIDVDTDQIIPARFLSVTTRGGLGACCFADWRFDAEGHVRTGFALYRPDASPAPVLVTGRNFGCGSSREHAAWALLDYGIRVVISVRFADIFRSNALKNGLLAIEVPEASWRVLREYRDREVAVDLEANVIQVSDACSIPFEIDGFARQCLLQGVDSLGYLLSFESAIARFEERGPRPENT